MSESISVTLPYFSPKKDSPLGVKYPLELKLSFDGENHFIEEAWLDETIDFYSIADKYDFLDKLLEEALKQLKLDNESAMNERSYIESFD